MSQPTVTHREEIAPGTAERLGDLAAAYRDAQHTLTVHRDRLHAAIVDAIDNHGLRPADAARAVGVSQTRIYAIIEHHYRHADR